MLQQEHKRPKEGVLQRERENLEGVLQRKHERQRKERCNEKMRG